MSVTVGKSSVKPEPQLLTAGFMANLQKKLILSESKLLKLAREFKSKGIKFEDHIQEDLEKLSHCLDEFYTVENLEFEEKKGKKGNLVIVKRDLAYLKDPAKFIERVITERGLEKEKVMVQVGLDSGQGSFKFVVSIFQTDYDPEVTLTAKEGLGSWLTGANRLLVMALAEDLQEMYQNLRTIVTKLKLNEIQCSLACDLKLMNVILGISSHSGKHACPYCEREDDPPSLQAEDLWQS